MATVTKFGIIGLGKMGGNLALQAMEKGFSVVGLDKSDLSADLKSSKIVKVSTAKDLAANLTGPRVALIYVGAGPIIDSIIDDLVSHFQKGDVIVDAGNSYWGDSIRRYRRLKEKGIQFIDCGTSGGVNGARHGACFMIGGEKEAVALVEPILKKLAVENGYAHAGAPGSGHFTKLVHNGIEFGMLQAIGEGMDLLENFREHLDIKNILTCWNHGSVVRSWLMELMEKAYRDKNGMDSIPSYVEDTGEVNWLVNDALHMEVATPVISMSVIQLLASRDEKKNWARAIAMMRNGFGGHPFGKDDYIKKIRHTSRVGDFLKD
jgi:6-phosphogluconate dehydrogenase